MYELLRRRVLAMLKVPPEPHAPVGDPASLRVFNAGRNLPDQVTNSLSRIFNKSSNFSANSSS